MVEEKKVGTSEADVFSDSFVASELDKKEVRGSYLDSVDSPISEENAKWILSGGKEGNTNPPIKQENPKIEYSEGIFTIFHPDWENRILNGYIEYYDEDGKSMGRIPVNFRDGKVIIEDNEMLSESVSLFLYDFSGYSEHFFGFLREETAVVSSQDGK